MTAQTMIGTMFLENFVVTIDGTNNRIRLASNGDGPLTPPALRYLGVALRQIGDEMEIWSVHPDSHAEELGLDVDFGERCDTESGRVKVQTFFAPECYVPFEGDNGGATARGVTADTIRIVQWVSQEQDPILEFITSAILNDDTNADDEATLRGMIEYYETYYETYGRNVELIVVEGSGAIIRGRRC